MLTLLLTVDNAQQFFSYLHYYRRDVKKSSIREAFVYIMMITICLKSTLVHDNRFSIIIKINTMRKKEEYRI